MEALNPKDDFIVPIIFFLLLFFYPFQVGNIKLYPSYKDINYAIHRGGPSREINLLP